MTRQLVCDLNAQPVENQYRNPSFARAVGGSRIFRKNWIINPNFTNGITGWGGGAGTLRQASDAIYGVCGEVTTSGSGASAANGQSISQIPVRPGEVWSVGFDVWTPDATAVGRQVWARVSWFDSSRAPAGTTVASSVERLSLTIQRLSGTVTVPAGAAFLRLDVYVNSSGGTPAAGQVFRFKRMQAERHPVLLPFFAGDTEPALGFTYAFEGTPHESPSVARAGMAELYRNFHRNPGASNPAFLELSNWSGGGGNTVSAELVDVSWSKSGKAYQVTWNQTPNPGQGDAGVVVTQATPNTVFTVEYDLAISGSGSLSRPNIYAATGSWTTIARSHDNTFTVNAGEVVRCWLTFTADATALSSSLRTTQTPYNKTPGTSFRISNIQLYPGPKRSIGYFDGNSSPDGDMFPAWDFATVDASQSALYGVVPADGGNSGGSTRTGIMSWSWSSRGETSLRILPVGSSGASSTDNAWSPEGDRGAGMRLGLKPGRTYTVLAKLRLRNTMTSEGSNARRIVGYYTLDGSSYTTQVSPRPSNAPGVYPVRLTWSIPEAATEAFVRLFLGSTADSVWWDDFTIVEGKYEGPHIDGDLPGCVWRGARHASTSIGYPQIVQLGAPD